MNFAPKTRCADVFHEAQCLQIWEYVIRGHVFTVAMEVDDFYPWNAREKIQGSFWKGTIWPDGESHNIVHLRKFAHSTYTASPEVDATVVEKGKFQPI